VRSACRTSRTLLAQAIDAVGAANIATNQVGLHPYLQNRSVAAFARAHGIQVTACMPLAYGKVLADPAILSIAARQNLAANLEAPKLVLAAEDIAALDAMGRGERLVSPDFAPARD
jgi:2,5-diketo-D-gluconate reductase B